MEFVHWVQDQRILKMSFHSSPLLTKWPCKIKLSFYLSIFLWADTAFNSFWKVQPRGRQVLSVLPGHCPCLCKLAECYKHTSPPCSVDALWWELEWGKSRPPTIKPMMGILSWTLTNFLNFSMSLQHKGGNQIPSWAKGKTEPLLNKTVYFFDWLSEVKRVIKITLIAWKKKLYVS